MPMLTQPPVPFFNPLHAAVTEMLCEVKEGSCAKPVKDNKAGNWRTGQLMRELKGAKTIAEVVSFEQEFRGVVNSQETRARVKLIRACFHAQWLLDEREMLLDAEKQDRSALESMAAVVLSRTAAMGTIIGHEMYFRHLIKSDFFNERYDQRIARNAFYISVEESVCRQCLGQVETFERRETEQRRFLAAGREIDMELMRHQTRRITFWAEATTSNFYRAVALLSAEEERERISLERFFLLKLSLIANDEENSAARLVVVSVMRASLLRRRLKDDVKQRELAERVLMIPLKEADTRNLIEKVEMEKRQELRVCFFLSWRTAFKKALVPSEGAEIVEHLEVYERLCVFDQWRYGFNALEERHYHERRLIAKREEKFEELYSYVVQEITTLWSQESEEFNCLCKQYSDFQWSQRMLPATDVLQTEERYLRYYIAELELRGFTDLLMRFLLRECECAAAHAHAHLCALERFDRSQLAHQFRDAWRLCLFDSLEREEFASRGSLERLARVTQAELFASEAFARGAAADERAIDARAAREAFAREQQRRERLRSAAAALALEEWAQRREAGRREGREREAVYAAALSLAEQWNRNALRAEEESAARAVRRLSVAGHEETARKRMAQAEEQRRGFLRESMDYAHPFLRACEVDELEKRMDIITLAELNARTMAFRHGLDRRITYCSEELRTRHALMRFMSTQELLQVLELDLVKAAEPTERSQIAKTEERDRLVIKLARDECIGRARIEAIASAAREDVHALFDRLISREDQWRTRGAPCEPLTLSGPKTLMRYFLQMESSTAHRRRAELERRRQIFGTLFQKFYWTRDAIVVQEFIARQSCVRAFHQKQSSSSLTDTTPKQVSLRFYNLSIMSDNVLESLVLKMWDSEESSDVTCDLHEAQSISAANGAFYVFFPTHLTEWVQPADDKSHLFYFEVRDRNGVLVATASYFLQNDALGSEATLLSIPIDGCMGTMNVVLYVR